MDGEQALREHFEATNRRDYPAAMSYYDEHVVLFSFATGFDAGAYHGVDAVGGAFGDWMRAFGGGVAFGDLLVERGRDAYAVSARMTARGRESGIELAQDWAWVYWMRVGKIVRVEIHTTVDTARSVAGVEPA
ncbi:MAG TPA: nuclear transport factor 2 family protein [Thermoleophilaceae bacterium]|nr:nuclear transport factor 2 family protein [Thermoleophilaceae bacterium]